MSCKSSHQQDSLDYVCSEKVPIKNVISIWIKKNGLKFLKLLQNSGKNVSWSYYNVAVVLVQLAVLIGRVKLHCMEWYFSAPWGKTRIGYCLCFYIFVVQYIVQYIEMCCSTFWKTDSWIAGQVWGWGWEKPVVRYDGTIKPPLQPPCWTLSTYSVPQARR